MHQGRERSTGNPCVYLNAAAAQKSLNFPQGDFPLASPTHRLYVDTVGDYSGWLHHLLHQCVESLGEAAALQLHL